MSNIPHLRKTIGAFLGKVLTPEMAAQIEVSADYQEDNRIDIEKFDRIERGDLVFQAERMHGILPELHGLHQMHWAETEGYRHGFRLHPDYDAMLLDECAGRLLQFTIRKHESLIGNLRMYVVHSRHTRVKMAVEDTLFIVPSERGGFSAMTLMRLAEKSLRSIGVRQIECTSKVVNKADVLMRRMKYEHFGHQFVKIFPENSHVQ